MSVLLFRLLLLLYPRSFRKKYQGELLGFFLADRSHPRYKRTLIGPVRFWIKTVWDAVKTAHTLRMGGDRSSTGRQQKGHTRRIGSMDTFLQDIRYAIRGMLRQPGFSLIVLTTLALGIGANTAVFGVLNSVVLRPLPYQDPEDLVFVWEKNYLRDVDNNVVSPANYFVWKEQNNVFSGIGTISEMSASITGEAGPEQVGMVYLSPSIFNLLGTRPQLGRLLVENDERPGFGRVVVLSDGFWQRRFGSDPDVIGESVILNGSAYEVVGVLPRGFDFEVPVSFDAADSRDLWIPTQFDENARAARGRWLQVLARLKPGTSLEQAQNQMTSLASRLEQEFPEFQAGWSINLVPLHTQMVGEVRTPLFMLLGSVGFVLLIACANVANLLLARGTGRQREVAVRAALGAGRSRVIRQLITESTVLAVFGGAAGLMLAYAAIQALIAFNPQNLPRVNEITIDLVIVCFTVGVSIVTGLIFGAVPAFRVASSDLKTSLVEGGERGGTGLKYNRMRGGLVVAEFALSMILLVGAGLLIRSFGELLDVDVGFDSSDVFTAQLALPNNAYPEPSDRIRFFESLVDRVQAVPGVTAASAITFMPFGGPGSATSFWANDREIPDDGELPVADIRWVHRDFHSALGVPLVAGRTFLPQDTEDAPLVAVINTTAANQIWPGESSLGKTISMPWGDTLVAEVVGVVGDVLHNGPTTEVRPKIYWDHRQFNTFSQMTVFIRSPGDPQSIATSLRQVVADFDPDLPLYNLQNLETSYSEILAEDRFVMLALGLFALVALCLASVGIYGVMSYSVNEKAREIGIKMALGARASAVTLQVLGSGAALLGIAIGLGLAGSLALSRLMSGLVFGISTNDPITLAAVTVVLAAVAIAACYLPARRASRIDPMKALRQE